MIPENSFYYIAYDVYGTVGSQPKVMFNRGYMILERLLPVRNSDDIASIKASIMEGELSGEIMPRLGVASETAEIFITNISRL